MGLRLGEIDINKPVVKPKLYLCKPNKEIISRMGEAYEIEYSQRLGSLNELNFKLPIQLDKHHTRVENPNAFTLRGRYLVRLVLGNHEEYFIIYKTEKVFDDEEYIEVSTYGLGYELNDKMIRDYEVQSLNATALLNSILKDTIWTIGYVDVAFDIMYRGLDVSSSTVLEVVNDIAQTFGALIVWDTLKRTINFYLVENVGNNKGFTIKYGKYLESLNEEKNSEEVVTRLKMFGKEDITINSLTPTGSNFIEDFTYFLLPYKEHRNYSSEKIRTATIRDNWYSDNISLWSVNSDGKLLVNTINPNSNIIVNNNVSVSNYKINSTFKATSGDGGLGFVARVQNNLNYYLIKWEKGSPNTVLDNLNVQLEQAELNKEQLESNLAEAQDDTFNYQTEKAILMDSLAVKTDILAEKEALRNSEMSKGNDVSVLNNEINILNNEINQINTDIVNTSNDITNSQANEVSIKSQIDQAKVNITNLKTDIMVEESNSAIQKLKVYKVQNGMKYLLAETSKLRGWEHGIGYSISVEVVGDLIKVWIDNVLALTAKDSTFVNGGFGFYVENIKMETTGIDVEYKDYEIISRSDYMSDELCHHLLDYEELVESKSTEFQLLLGKKKVVNGKLDIKEHELVQLVAEYKTLLDERDILNTRISTSADQIDHYDNLYDDYSVSLEYGLLNSLQAELSVKLQEIQVKENEMTFKENEIVLVRDELNQIEYQIELLGVLLNVENNFPTDILNERNQFIIEKEWTDSNIDDVEDLLKEGKKVFEEYKKQKITLSVSIVNFLNMVTEQRNWDKLGLGDTFKVQHERLKVYYEAKVTKIDYDFEDGEISIEISNIEDLSNKDAFLEMLYSSNSTSTTVSMDKWKWDLSMENKGSINDIINNIWDANKQAIMGAKDQVVEISDRGLIIRDPNDPNNYLVGINSMLAITNDGGDTWKHAITSTGIVGERIYGKVIMGVNLAIEDEHGIVKWQGSKGEIFDRNGDLVMKLGLVSEPPESNGDCFGLMSFNDVTRVQITDCEGFAIERMNTSSNDWEKILWASTDGTLYAEDLVASNLKIVNNVGDTILDAEANFFDIGKFEQIAQDNKLITPEKLRLITELEQIHSDYKLLLKQAEEYIRVHRNDTIDIGSQWLNTTPSTTDRYSTSPVTNAYLELITYMSQFVKVVNNGVGVASLQIDIHDPLTESTSEISDRAEFILKFKKYYDEAEKLRQAIEDALYYAGIHMNEFYNNVVIGQHGFIALRNDGKYRAYLNSTNGLALQKWENGHWESKLFATLGHPDWEDGTLYAEGMVTKNLRIVDGELGDKIVLDAEDGITIYGNNGEVIVLNGNEGIGIYVDGINKFFVDTDGRLYATDITTHGLRIVDGELGEKITFDQDEGITIYGNNGEVIRLNANEAIAIDVDGDPRLWIGTNGLLYAKKLIIMEELDEAILDEVSGSYISDLTVNKLRTLNTPSPADHIWVADNFFRILTGGADGNAITKFELTTVNGGTHPKSTWGAGDGSGNDKGYIYKTNDTFTLEYQGMDGTFRTLQFNDTVEDAVKIYTQHKVNIQGNRSIKLQVDSNNYLEITPNGVKIVGTRIDLN